MAKATTKPPVWPLDGHAISQVTSTFGLGVLMIILIIKLTDSAGFEPATSSLEGWRHIQSRPRAHEIENYRLVANTIVIIKYFYYE
jgi:hypothetical protein